MPKKVDKSVLDSIESIKDLLKLFHHTPKNNDRSEYIYLLKKQYELRLIN